MNYASALNQYKSVSLQSGIEDATPHQLITKLLDGALDRLASAKGSISRNEVARKGELLSSVITILDSMRASLDYDKGGEIAVNLGALYGYMERRLLEANVSSDLATLDEVSELLREIKSGWESVPVSVRNNRS
ncbi:flagellar export chaperone FliS [Porticoccus sp.]